VSSSSVGFMADYTQKGALLPPTGRFDTKKVNKIYTVGQKKVFSQSLIVQVLPLKTMREACNFHHRYTSTMTDKMRGKHSRKSHCRIFNEFICKLNNYFFAPL
jgi:hypothetical protein